MACSTSQGSSEPYYKKINDAVYELYKPTLRSVNLEIVFFHGFQSPNRQKAFVETWMGADGSVCWLNTWLPEKFPHSRILSVSYDSSVHENHWNGKMDMFLVGENLARSIIELARVGQTCPVVFVGYCVGGLVLKEVCCKAERLGIRRKAGHGMNPYNNFLNCMKGAFFYSTCHLGTRILTPSETPGSLLDYYKLLNKDTARLNEEFSEIRKRIKYQWKTWGVLGMNETESSKIIISCIRRWWDRKRQRTVTVTEEGSARIDMDEFCPVPGEDHASICRPKDQCSSSFRFLVDFVEGILDNEEYARQWASSLQFPLGYKRRPDRVKEVIRMLELHKPEPSGIYLVGMGGIGKSTLAKEVMVEIRWEFDIVCFVNDVKARLNDHNLHTLIAENLYHSNGSKLKVKGDEQSLWQILRGKKVLLTMDNVDSEDQIGTLLRPDSVRRVTRLIITSREQPQKLARSFKVHKVPRLSPEESKSLFLDHLDPTLVQIPGKLIDQVVAKCDGLPLTLHVAGSSLCSEKDVSIWEESLTRLTKAQSVSGSANDQLWAKLRAIFYSLAPVEQETFLDLAMFDKCGPYKLLYDLDIWKAVWNEGAEGKSVKLGLRNLERKFFLSTVRRYDEIPRNQPNESKLHYLASSDDPIFVTIHEQLRDMGRSICRPPDEHIDSCRGLWEMADVDKLLMENQKRNHCMQTLLVTMDQSAASPLSGKMYSWRSIAHLRTLRLLRMSSVGLIDDGASRFPPNLAMLHLNTCFSEEDGKHSWLLEDDGWPIRESDVAQLQRMTVLILEKCMCVRLPSNFHLLGHLRILIIEGGEFTKLPENFTLPRSLAVLILKRVALSRIPNSFYLSSLEKFTLKSCLALEYLPEWPNQVPPYLQNISSHQSKLKQFVLEDLSALRKLPVTLEHLDSLEKLSISRCISLLTLPENFQQLGALQKLVMEGCSNLSQLPEMFGQLPALQELDMSWCIMLSMLPRTFVELRALQRLLIRGCTKLSRLPVAFGQLHALKELDMTGCIALRILPETFGELRCLQRLVIHGCTNLSTLHDTVGHLHNLREFDMSRCIKLSALPSTFGGLRALQRLVMEGCSALKMLPESFGQLGDLKNLDIKGCTALGSLCENFGELGALKILDMTECSSMSSLPANFGKLGCLESLIMIGCIGLSQLPPTFGQLAALTRLDMTRCILLSTLPDTFGDLAALRRLDLTQCTALSRLPDRFGKLSSLRSLNMTRCTALFVLPPTFSKLGALKSLCMIRCTQLSELPKNFEELCALQVLDLGQCIQLSKLPENFQRLGALKSLNMTRCTALRMLPENFGELRSLKKLSMNRCITLSSLPRTFGDLSALKSLSMNHCTALCTLASNFEQLGALERLEMKGCSALSNLGRNFEKLEALNYLDVTGCYRLSELPENLGRLGALKTLVINRCTALVSVPITMGELRALMKLCMINCTAVSTLPPNFGQLRALQHLNLKGCIALSELPRTFGQLTALTTLNMSGCTSLSILPDGLGRLRSLKTWKMSGCTSLFRLPAHFGPFGSLERLVMIGCPGLVTLPHNFSCLARLEKQGCKIEGGNFGM